jgi:hypothetical protein
MYVRKKTLLVLLLSLSMGYASVRAPWTYMGSEPMKIWSVCGAERTGLKVDSERYIDKYSTCQNFHTFSRNVGFVLDATSGWICSSVAGIT